MEGLQPHPNLRKLKIERFGGKRFPTWTPVLNSLMEITLLDCHGCEEIPTLGHLPHLKSIHLWRLRNVTTISYSFYGIDKCKGASVFLSLESILLSDMPKLTEWVQAESPPQHGVAKVFPRLRSMSIKDCKQLESLPSQLFINTHDLREIKIENCSVLRELPEGMQGLTTLEDLIIKGCTNLTKEMAYPSNGGGGSLTSLRRLTITDCQELTALVESWVPALGYLELVELTSLRNLPTFIDCLAESTHLKEVKIIGVPKFMSAGGVKVWPFRNLRKLEIDASTTSRVCSGPSGESSAAAIMETVNGMLRECGLLLTDLTLTGLGIWECLPESIQHLTAVKELELKNFGVEELPEWLGNLSSLQRLHVFEFSKLRRLPYKDAMRQPSPAQLQTLYIRGCPELSVERDDDDNSERPNISRLRIIHQS